MKTLLEFDETLLDNASDFEDPFFKRFTLRHAPKPIQLTPAVAKDYLFPTFYNDVTCAQGIFFCSWKKASQVMPHPAIQPVKMGNGRAIVAFSCYEYKKVMGVPPYNEIAVAIPVMVNTSFNPAVLPMVMSSFKHFGYYILSMPVTSLENQRRGVTIWGLPKVVQEINIVKDGDVCITEAKDENNECYFRLKVPTLGKPKTMDVKSYLYSKLDGKINQGETNFKGDFQTNAYMNRLFSNEAGKDEGALWLGDSPFGRQLKDLEIEPAPFQFRYAEHMTSCFDLPNANPPAWVSELSH